MCRPLTTQQNDSEVVGDYSERMSRLHIAESHRSHRAGWLRAAVLGANDGIVSTSALLVGVIAAGTTDSVWQIGLASIVAGAASMAVGEYVSVSSQADVERSDTEKERRELVEFPEAELHELTEIYVARGLDRELAKTVATRMHEHDALGAHLRDELGLDGPIQANPIQAASVSAFAFAVGAAIPTLLTLATTSLPILGVFAVVLLGLLGGLGSFLAGSSLVKGAIRVVVGGALALGLSVVIGDAVGGAV